MANCLVTITAKSASGAAVPNATLTFIPLPADRLRVQDGAVIWPTSIQGVCDAAGIGSITLKTGDYTYQAVGPLGTVLGRVTIPDLVTIALDLLIGTAELPYAQISWAEYQTLVSLTAFPAVSVTAGLAAVVDGTVYLALSDDGVSIIKRVGAAAVPCFVEL